MHSFPWLELAILIALIVFNGLFAMSELAIVSARTAQLRIEAERGSGAAKVALALHANPGKFLSTVQIGITGIAVITGYYSGATLSEPVSEGLAALGVPARYAAQGGVALVMVVTTFLSLVIGELVPKQIALAAAIPIALTAARPMALFARVAAPLVWLLESSSDVLLRLLRVRHKGEHKITAEELQMIFADATHSGAIEEEERAMLSGIMRLADRPVRELMTPRIDLDWIELADSDPEIRKAIEDSPHSWLPVADGSPDNVVGAVKVREVLARLLAGKPAGIAELMRKAEVVPDQLDAMDALRLLQSSGTGLAMVHDEYGHLEGIVTPADLLAAIAGNFVSHQDEGDEPMVVERADGSLLLSGALPADALAERLEIELPEDREFATAAGYVLWMLKKLPREGEWFDDQGWRFEVVDMDGRKIDKLLVCKA